MAKFSGLFELMSAPDLLRKLRHDFTRLQSNPLDQYAAFDFFVTAEHLVDWFHPADESARRALRASDPLLQVCSHIANGAKHFEATAKHHTSVVDTSVHHGAFQRGAFQEDAFDVSKLIVRLDGAAATKLGAQIEVLQLARRLLQFWEDLFRSSGVVV
jgi:hypothetical protein